MEYKTHQDKIETLRELIKDIDFAMLTTIDADGSLLSRPMSTQEAEFDGDLWFFTSEDTGKVGDIRGNNRVNVAYARPDDHTYVSVSGAAELQNDRAKMEELWSPVYKAYFPDGLDDPQLRLIKVHVDKAEYWKGHGLVRTVIGFAKALAGQESELGENEKMNLRR